jgi:hypothetical protein
MTFQIAEPEGATPLQTKAGMRHDLEPVPAIFLARNLFAKIHPTNYLTLWKHNPQFRHD